MYSWRDTLSRNRQKIGLDFDDTSIESYSEYILESPLTSEQLSDIRSGETEEERVERFLDFLINESDQKQLKGFVHFLGDCYDWLQELFYSAECDPLDFGGVPYLPVYNITRTRLITDLTQRLRLMKPCEWLVVHGMAGSGKTCLVTEALRGNPQIVRQFFSDKVFWQSVGSEKADTVRELQEWLHWMLPNSGHHLSTFANTVSATRAYLQNQIKKNRMENCLLILDDVPIDKIEEIVEALNVKCKILMTSREKITSSLVNMDYLQVDHFFTWEETQKMWASILKIRVDKLTEAAEMLFAESKGFPMIVSYICDQLETNREEAKNNTGFWSNLIGEIRRSSSHANSPGCDASRRLSWGGIDDIVATIGYSVERLPPHLRSYYENFALFIEDVNIKPQVLAILWSLEVIEVNRVMIEFEKRNLAVKKWNQSLCSYVYGVHDLFLRYLRNNTDLVALHLRLLAKYKEKCNNDFSKLPTNDNYIFHYIGYHIYCARDLRMFSVYLDLNFIEAKLRATGPRDLLLDFRKYHDDIIQSVNEGNSGGNAERKLEDMVWLVESYGQKLMSYKETDIVDLCFRYALQSNFLLESAQRLAQLRPHRRYIRFWSGAERECSMADILHAGWTPTAVASISSDIVLVGYSDGRLSVWNFLNKNRLQTLSTHKKEITKLVRNDKNAVLVSCSSDGTVCVWSVDTFLQMDIVNSCEEGTEARTPSPRTVQESYEELWGGAHWTTTANSPEYLLRHDEPVISAAIASVCIRPETINLVSCSSTLVKLWEGTRLRWSFRVDAGVYGNVTDCAWCRQDELVVISCSTPLVLVLTSVNGRLLSFTRTPEPVFSLHHSRDNEYRRVVGVGDSSVSTLEAASREDNLKLVNSFCPDVVNSETKVSACSSSRSRLYLAKTAPSHVAIFKISPDLANIDTRFDQIVPLASIGECRSLSWFCTSRMEECLVAILSERTVRRWRLAERNYPLMCAAFTAAAWPADHPYPLIVSPDQSAACSFSIVEPERVVMPCVTTAGDLCAVASDGRLVAFTSDDAKLLTLVHTTPPTQLTHHTLHNGSDEQSRLIRVFKEKNDLYAVVVVSEPSVMRVVYVDKSATPLGEVSIFSCILKEEDGQIFDVFHHPSGELTVVFTDGAIKVWTRNFTDEKTVRRGSSGDWSVVKCVSSTSSVLAGLSWSPLVVLEMHSSAMEMRVSVYCLATHQVLSQHVMGEMVSAPRVAAICDSGYSLAIAFAHPSVVYVMDTRPLKKRQEVKLNGEEVRELAVGCTASSYEYCALTSGGRLYLWSQPKFSLTPRGDDQLRMGSVVVAGARSLLVSRSSSLKQSLPLMFSTVDAQGDLHRLALQS